jgi:leader peptidase (prepilin peptidase)/N-methyltransferase
LDLSGANEWFYFLALFLFGIVFGSFGNVVIWRLPRGESLSHPASHCPGCNAPIAWYDNIPVVSWLILGGRCRSCGNPISPRYPLVEALSGCLWLVAGARFGFTFQALWAVVFFYLLMLLAFIDWDLMRLPNQLVLWLLGAGLVGVAVAEFTGEFAVPLFSTLPGYWGSPWLAALVGAVSASGLMLLTSLLYGLVRGGRGYGMGDIKLMAVIGVYLGTYSLMTLFFATIIGAVYGIFAARGSEEGGRHKFPFGPFIVIAAVLVALAGPQIWAWYWSLAHLSL